MPAYEVTVRMFPETLGLSVRETVAGPAEIPPFLGDGFAALGMAGVSLSGPPLVVYHALEASPAAIDLELVCPAAPEVAGPLLTPGGRSLTRCVLPAGEAATLTHVGPYDALGEAYQALEAWIAAHGYRVSGPPQEIYMTGPTDPGPPVTEVRFPVARV
mgnify:CR=1 FL=1